MNAVNVISAGGNIFDGVLESGWFDNNGADSPNADRVRSKNFLRCLPSTSYYVTCSDSWRVYWYDSAQAFISYSGTYSANRAVTSPSDAVYFRLAIIATEPTDVGMNYPSTDTSAQTPKAQTTYTANLGRTVYGADVDLVSGQGKETYGYIVFDGSDDETWYDYANYEGYSINIATMKVGNRQDGVCNQLTKSTSSSQGQSNVFWLGVNTSRFYVIGVYQSMGNTLEAFKAYLAENPLILVYPLATETDFTFDGQEIPSLLGVNNLWHDAGETEAVYRSSGTITEIQPVLTSKTITENGTYSAAADNADGYDSVSVAVPLPINPEFTETQLVDNSGLATSFTLSEDYGNYDMVKVVFYDSYNTKYVDIVTTPDMLDEIFSVSTYVCFNNTMTNRYACYSKSGLTWTRGAQRTGIITAIYGIKFTNCVMTATDLYKRGALTTTAEAITSQTSLKQYDMFVMSAITNTDGSETVICPIFQNSLNSISSKLTDAVFLGAYYTKGILAKISEYGFTAGQYFMVQGIKFTANS